LFFISYIVRDEELVNGYLFIDRGVTYDMAQRVM